MNDVVESGCSPRPEHQDAFNAIGEDTSAGHNCIAAEPATAHRV
ncbi:MAG: hypothetical protein JWL86_2114 [Rhizobium sp.]|nr:hypothetical protein [Rhizobium sp.]